MVMKAVVLSNVLNLGDELRIEIVEYSDVLLTFNVKGGGEYVFRIELYKLVDALKMVVAEKMSKRFFR